MEIESLTRSFPASPNPGLDTLDPRWGEISAQVQEGNFTAAAQQSESLLKEDVCDIRLASYLAFGLFLEQGMPALAPTLQGISGLLTTQWENVGPGATKVKAAQAALTWLVKQLARKLEHEESQKGPVWEQWTGQIEPDGVDVALDAVGALQRALGSALEDRASQIVEPLGKVREWLQSFRQVVYKPEPEPEPEPEAEAAAEETSRPATGTGAMAEGSWHLQQLLRKMAAFEQLIERGEFPRARIVADDIQATIEAFDPVLYFPSLFTNFVKLVATHTGELAALEEARETPDWKALQALYRVDLDEFVAL